MCFNIYRDAPNDIMHEFNLGIGIHLFMAQVVSHDPSSCLLSKCKKYTKELEKQRSHERQEDMGEELEESEREENEQEEGESEESEQEESESGESEQEESELAENEGEQGKKKDKGKEKVLEEEEEEEEENSYQQVKPVARNNGRKRGPTPGHRKSIATLIDEGYSKIKIN
jgi:glutamyl/glutaminyl-tRNA synthetase